MKKQNKYILLTDYKSIVRDSEKFRNDIIDKLGDQFFHYSTLDEIVYHSLKLIYPVNRYIKNNEASIEKKAGEVLEHFGIKKPLRASITNLSTGKTSNNENEFKKTYKKRYLENILRIKHPPKREYNRLKLEAEEHLIYIYKRIEYYSSKSCVINFKEKKVLPKNNYDRTLVDFYIRCTDEQQKILDFIYSEKLKDRALLKSNFFLISLPPSFIWGIYDFPYRSSIPHNKNFFNHKLIASAHRIGGFPIKESYKMENLYYKDKTKFYKKYFKHKSKKHLLKSIEYNLDTLPISQDRKLIIKEIIKLFNQKRWVGFYGLALSQIEGLFSEMLTFLPKKLNARSLTRKVNVLRGFYNLSDSYFDYFEYYIPELRNAFMHGALDGSEKEPLNSYDFLLDIHFLLNTIKELDSPYIALNNKINNNSIQISTIEEVSILFDLSNSLNIEQKKDLDHKLIDFYKSNLIDNKNLEYILYSINETIEKDINKLIGIFEHSFSTRIDFKHKNFKEIDEFFKNENELEKLKDIFLFHDSDLQQMIGYKTFFKNYKRKLPIIPEELTLQIQSTFNNRKNNINKLCLLCTLIK